MQSSFILKSKKYLALITILLLLAVVPHSPKAHAAENTSRGRACNTNIAPTPYANGAAVARVFYPADGSTVTVTSTGAVIKQSPCQTPYREGWVNPSNICNLNQFSQLGGMLSSADNNPYPNSTYNYSCTNPAPAAATPAPAPAPVVTRPADVTVNQTINNPTTPVTPNPAPVVYGANTSRPATSLPDTGPNNVLAVGGISTVLGTVGHYFYRRRVLN